MRQLESVFLPANTDSQIEGITLNIQDLSILYSPGSSDDQSLFINEMIKTEHERKFVSRAVMVISGVLFLLSLALVGVSLTMSNSIDDLGKCSYN